MSLLKDKCVRSIHISAIFCFIFLKNSLKKTLKFFLIPNFDLSGKIGKVIIKEGKFKTLFCSLIPLILGENTVKGLESPKLTKEKMFH